MVEVRGELFTDRGISSSALREGSELASQRGRVSQDGDQHESKQRKSYLTEGKEISLTGSHTEYQ